MHAGTILTGWTGEDAAPFQEDLLPHPSAKSTYEWGTLNMESQFLGFLVGL